MNKFRVLDKLSDFPQHIGKPFELESQGISCSFKVESFGGIDTILTAFTKVFVRAFELINCKEFL